MTNKKEQVMPLNGIFLELQMSMKQELNSHVLNLLL